MQKKSSVSNHSWSTPESIQASLRSKWDKGVFLNAEDSDTFPLLFPIKGPSASELTEHYSEAQKWVTEFEFLNSQNCVQVVWEDRSHRLSGKNRFPIQLCFTCPNDLANFVGRISVWKNWNAALKMVNTQIPELMPYWQQHSGKCLILAQDLQKLGRLLSVCQWCRSYILEQKERIYVRQISLEGVHTKFIESNKSVLASWIDFLCPEQLLNNEYSRGSDFAKRYGFLDKPQLVRIRILDSKYYLHGLSDLTLRPEELANFELPVQNVFICENNVTCLSFPQVPDSILIFGGGYGFDAVSQVSWLHAKKIFYWGDLDSNGFCILDQLKSHFSHTQSFLMDENTLLKYKEFWCREDRPSCRNLTNLNEVESNTYQGLCEQKWGDHVRLEQELIPMSSVKSTIGDLVARNNLVEQSEY